MKLDSFSYWARAAVACACVGVAFGACADDSPPAYEFLEYASTPGGTDSPRVNTEVVPASTMEFRFKYAMDENNGYRGVFGSYSAEDALSTRIICNNGNAKQLLVYFLSRAGGGSTTMTMATGVGEVVEGHLNYTSAKLNAVTANMNHTSGNACTVPMHVFAAGPTSAGAKSRFWYFSILDNGVYTHHYLPCRRTADGVVGLWNAKSNVFVPPTGTGTLAAGPVNPGYRLNAGGICQFGVVATVKGKGTVQANGGAAGATASAWSDMFNADATAFLSLTTTLTATPDAGWRFVRWEGDVENLTDAERTSPTLTRTVSASAALTAVFVPELTASACVQDGLVLHWDAIENAGAGTHNSAATKWIDLSGNGHDLTLPAGITFGEKSATVSKTTATVGGCDFATNSTPLTLESSVKVVSTTVTTSFTILAVRNRAVLGIDRRSDGTVSGKEGCYCVAMPSSASWGNHLMQYYWFRDQSWKTRINVRRSLNVRCGVETGGNTGYPAGVFGPFYEDGELQPSYGTGWNSGAKAAAPTKEVVIGAADTVVEANSFRIYDRKLSEAEIRYNAAIDATRFADETLPDGFGFDASAKKVTMRVKATCRSDLGSVALAGGTATETYAAVGASVTLVATPAAGCRFVRWVGDVGESDEAALASPTFTVTVGHAPHTLIALFATDAGLDAANYVQEGLIAQWDGNENAGVGVSNPKATSWTELKGGLATTITGALTFTNNAALFDGNTYLRGNCAAATSAISNGAFTVEYYVRPECYRQYGALFSFGNAGSGTRYFTLGGDLNNNGFLAACQYKQSAWDGTKSATGFTLYNDNRPILVTAIANGTRYYLYTNGVLVAGNLGGTVAKPPDTSFFIGHYNQVSSPQGNFACHAIRWYDRVLSEEEIRLNAAIDQVRFPTPPDGEPYILSDRVATLETGFRPTPQTRVVADFRYADAATVQQRIFGFETDSASYLTFSQYINGSSGYSWAAKDGTGNWTQMSPTVTVVGQRVHFDLDLPNSQVILETPKGYGCVAITNTITTTRTKTSQYPLALFAARNGASACSNPARAKLYSLKIYDGGVLQRYYLPWTDGEKVGVRDALTGALLPFINQGTLVYGRDLTPAATTAQVDPSELPEGFRWNEEKGLVERHFTLPAVAGHGLKVDGQVVESMDTWFPPGTNLTIEVTGEGKDDPNAVVEWEGLPESAAFGDRRWSVTLQPTETAGLKAFVRKLRFVDYLASHTLEYIDTGHPFVANRKFVCDWANDCYRYTDENKGYGAGGANASDISGGGRIANSAIQPYILNGNRATTPAYTYSTLYVGDRFRDTVTVGATAQLVMERMESDTTYTSTAVTTPANYSSVANINLFRDGYTSAPHPGAKRIYRATLVDTTTGETIFDLFPCVADGEGMFYDRISQRLLHNQAAGRFTPGPTRLWRFTDDGKVLAGVVVRAGGGAGQVTVSLNGAAEQTAAAITNYLDETTLPVTATIRAAPSTGTSFLRWGGAPHGKIGDPFAASTTLTVDRAMQVSAGFRRDGVNSAKAYAASGLVALWDGLENQGAGEHDDAATTWLDATGHGYVFEGKNGKLSAGAAAPTYNGQCWSFNGTDSQTLSFMMPDGTELLPQNTNMTVEVFAEHNLPTANSTFGVISGWTITNSCGSAQLSFGVFLSGNQQYYSHYSGGYAQTGMTRYWQEYVDSDVLNASMSLLRRDDLHTFRYAPGGREMYMVRGEASRPLSRIDLGLNSGYSWFNGKCAMRVYAVRVYDRAITPEESALNHALDKMRYMGYAKEDANLPPNYDVDADWRVKVRHELAAGEGGSVDKSGEHWVAAGGAALVVKATPETGSRFVRWGGDVEGLPDVTAATLALPSDRPRRVTAIFAPTTPDETSYVQDGLLLQLDGIRNTRGGPNPSAGAWEDLAAGDGTTRDFILNGNAAFSGNSLSVAQGQREAAYFDGSVFDCGTVEVLMRPATQLATYGSWQVFNFGSNRELLIYRQYGFFSFRNLGYHGASYLGRSERACELRSAAATYVNNVPSEYFLDGAPAREIDPSTLNFDCGTASSKPSLAGRYNTDERQFAGEIYAIRVYSRRLTAAEIARNHAIDLARFGGTMSVRCLGDGSTKVSVNGAAAAQSVRVEAAPGDEVSLTATVPSNTRSVTWAGLPEDAIVSEDGRTVAFVVPEGGAPAISVKATILGSEHYVQGGASAIYDAFENAGAKTHDPAAKKWANLVDPANAMVIRGTSHRWTRNAFHSSKGDNTLETRTALLSEKEFFLSPRRGVTFEVSGRMDEKHDTSPLFCPMPYHDIYSLRHRADGILYTYWRNVSAGSRTSGTGDFTWSSTMVGGTGGTYHSYTHGQQSHTGNSTFTQFHHSRMFMMSRPLVNDTASYTEGRVYSARRYERKLAAGEIAVNAAIDAARYGTRGTLNDWQLVKSEPAPFGSPSPAVGATPIRSEEVGQPRTYSVGELGAVTGGRGVEQDGTRAVFAGYVLETTAGRSEGVAESVTVPVLSAGDVVLTWKWTVSHKVSFTDEGKTEVVTWNSDGTSVTLTSLAAAGRICRWEGLPDDAVVSDDTHQARFAIRGPVTCSVRTLGPVGHNAGDYLRFGLWAQYDAVENAGIGTFDGNAATWKDLAGRGGDIAVSQAQGGLWRDNAFYLAGAHAPSWGTGLSLTTPNKISAATWTIELLLRTPGTAFSYAWSMQGSSSANYDQFRAFFEANGNGWRQAVKNNYINTANSTYKYDQDIKVVSRYDGTKHYLTTYTNGVKWVAVSGTIASGNLSSQLGFLQSFGTDARLYTARVYERCLSDVEIGYNTALDQMRFFDARGSISLPEGFRFDANGHLEVRVRIAGLDGAQVSSDGSTWVTASTERWLLQDAPVTIRAKVASGKSVGKWTGVPGYATVSPDCTTVSFKAGEPLDLTAYGHTPTTVTWKGGTSELASDAANWKYPSGAATDGPLTGDSVVLNSGSAAMTWDIGNVTLKSWNQTAGYSGKVTFKTGRADDARTVGNLSDDGKWRELVIDGDVSLAGGTWTHLEQPSMGDATDPARSEGTGVYRLIVRVGGKFDLASGGNIDVTAKGFGQSLAPGSASHGGQGTGYWGGAGNKVYGKVKQVRTIGSSSYGNAGGGNVELHVTGAATINGKLWANGGPDHTGNGSNRSGGGIWITAASLTGAGEIVARPEHPGGGGGAGGGRISLMLTGTGKDFSGFTGKLSAHDSGFRYNAGTIYMETAAQHGVGDLLIRGTGQTGDGNWWATSSGRSSHSLLLASDDPEDLHFHDLILTNGIQAAIGTNTVVQVDGRVIGDTAKDRTQFTYLCMRGGTLKLTNQRVLSNLTFRVYMDSPDSKIVLGDGSGTMLVDGSSGYYVDRDLEIVGNLHVLNGGRIQQAAPLTAQTVDSGFRCNLKVDGDATIDPGGSINVTGQGTPNGYGKWGIFSAEYPNGGGFHAANAPDDGDADTYGSIFCPTNLGSGGKSYYGGGSIKLFVDRTLQHDGAILANGAGAAANVGTGAGGSIWIHAQRLLGTGLIEAHGGDSTLDTGAGNPGAGGRISLELTGNSATFSQFTGNITARGGAHTNKTLKCRNNYSGAGTVFYRLPSETAATAGKVVIDNEVNTVWPTTRPTKITPAVTDHRVTDLTIQNGGWLTVQRGDVLEIAGSLLNASVCVEPNGETADATTAGGAVSFVDSTRASEVKGTNVFTSLSVVTPGKTVKFGTAADSLASIAPKGLFTMSGTEESRVLLRSVKDGTFWPFQLGSGALVVATGGDVKDSDARYGLRVVVDDTNHDSGNNKNWSFLRINPGDTIYWTGEVSSDWADPDNWSPERAPVETDVVKIMAAGHSPQLSGSVRLNQLVVDFGATLNLAGYDLTITNGLTVTGTMNASDSKVVFASTGQQSVTLGGSHFREIGVQGGVRFLDIASADVFSANAAGSGYTIAFAAGGMHTFDSFQVLGVLNFTPAIRLESADPGSIWNLKVLSKARVTGAIVTDSTAAGITIAAEDPSVDGGNNENWIFGVKGNHWTGAGDGKKWSDERNWSLFEVPDAESCVYFDSAATVTLPAGETVTVLTFAVDSAGGLVTINAGDGASELVVGTTFEVGSTGSLELNVPTRVNGAAYVRSGGKLSHSIMGENRNSIKPWNRIDMKVAGDMFIEQGGEINTVRKGYNKNLGDSYRSRVHAARLAPDNTGWPAYGSVFHPVHGGESYDNWSGCAGGGVVRLQVAGTLTVDGTLTCGGYYVLGGSGTAGGSVWITTTALAGAGLITAEGGKRDYAGGSAGTGGRVAIYVATEAGTNGFTGTVTAKGGSYGTAGSLPERPCGTVYWRFADDRQSAGTIILDNIKGGSNANFTDENGKVWGRMPRGATDLPAGEEGDDPALFFGVKIIVRNYGRLYLTTNVVVRDIVVEDKSDVFLNGYNLDVFSPVHRDRRGWSSDAFVFRPNRTDAKILGNIRWRKSGISFIFR